jgi:threonyl-tRNA synthetase
MGYKIREAQLQKIPYMIIIGDKEVEKSNISLRSRDRGDLGPCDIEETLREFCREIDERAHSVVSAA